MTGRHLALAAAVGILLAPPAAAQDSFGALPRPQPAPGPGALPQAGDDPGAFRQPGIAPPQAPGPGTDPLDRMAALERQDFGVPPTDRLHAGPMHAPTPASIPGGQVITTKGLLALIAGREVPFLLFDVLGGTETIPGAMFAVPAHQPGRFDDRIQSEFGAFLHQATGGNPEIPLVFFCLSNHCWMSYNAALRAIRLGYRNVLWYRGGLEAWTAAGQPTQPTRGGYGQLR